MRARVRAFVRVLVGGRPGSDCALTRPRRPPPPRQVVFQENDTCVAAGVAAYAARLVTAGWPAATLRQHLVTLAINEVCVCGTVCTLRLARRRVCVRAIGCWWVFAFKRVAVVRCGDTLRLRVPAV